MKGEPKPVKLTRALPILTVLLLLLGQCAFAQTNQMQTNPPATVATNSAPLPQLVSAPTQANQTVPPAIAPTNATSGRATELPDYSKYASLAISLLALGYTVWKDRKTDRRMKTLEREQEREKAEAAIRRSKASAPYFSPAKGLFNILYEYNEDGGIGAWTWNHGNVLTDQRKEMPKDAPEGSPVIIILNTNGKGARGIRISGDIPELEIKQEPDTHGGKGRVFLKYPYKPSQHGKKQKVILAFETDDGFDLTHTYETRHGCFEFCRVDPK